MMHVLACFVFCAFSVGPSVGPGVCPLCLVLLCLIFPRRWWANATFVSVCLFVFAFVMFLLCCLPVFFMLYVMLPSYVGC